MASPAAVSSAISKQPVLGDTKPNVSPPKQTFFVREMRLSDVPTLADYSHRVFWLTPLNNFLTPRAPDHPEQFTRMFSQGIRERYVNPRGLSVVACLKGDPAVPVGFLQGMRHGDDEGVRNVVREKGLLWRLWLFTLSWVFWAYDKIDLWLAPDVISDVENVKAFGRWFGQDNAKYWLPYPERKNRWHATTLIVNPDYQGHGVGRLLMGVVMEKAQRERVPCSLSASLQGEFLYRKLGFEWLGDFTSRAEGRVEEIITEDSRGGHMCWWPEGWEGKTLEDGEGRSAIRK